MEQNKKKINVLEKRLNIIGWLFIAVFIAFSFSTSWLASNVFSYEEEKTKIVEESYECVVDTVSTYVCYTTTYGDKYHAKNCGYLWNSAKKTTVYQAEKRGYGPCSRCTPREKTTYEIIETRYRDVEVTEIITKEPKFLVWISGTTIIVLTYYVSTRKLSKKIDNMYNELSADVKK